MWPKANQAERDGSVDKYQEILRQYWGYDDFRGIQREIIESIDQGRDTLGLMPTGGGKSITFQVPALLKGGVCLVVTPLIALMKDQVTHLRRKGILASAIYTGLTHDEIEYGWPILSIDRLYNAKGSGQLRTRFQAFVESLEIKKIQKARKGGK